jgi:chemosensory pili system protein ChpA (sensor histidine kinase/response regulator)
VVLLLNPAALSPNFAALSAGPAMRRMPTRQTMEVLIVDDSVSIRRTVAALVRGAGWNARLAKDGLEALDYLDHATRKPDVILMDIEMPRMDGYELAAAVRQRPALAGTPMVMLTSRAGEKHRRKALSLGVNEYLIKPYQDEVLLTVLRRAAQGLLEAPPLAS